MKKYSRGQGLDWFFIIFLSLVAFGYDSCHSNRDKDFFLSHPQKISKNVPDYFKALFTKESQGKLRLLKTVERGYKDTISNFLYDGKFIIQLYKISNSYSYSLKNTINEIYAENKQVAQVYFDGNFESQIFIYLQKTIFRSYCTKQFTASKRGTHASMSTVVHHRCTGFASPGLYIVSSLARG